MFVNREKELKTLRELQNKTVASLVVITGRRRIGKSSLIHEFSNSFTKFFEFQGLSPIEKKLTAQDQLDNFSEQLANQTNSAPYKLTDWNTAFTVLAKETSRGKILILIDEISWMANADATFLGKLKTAWDTKFKKNPNLILVLCGSVSSWIEENILNDTNFVGRITSTFKIEELSVKHSCLFWKNKHIAFQEKLRFLSVVGGVPRYLEEIRESLTAEQNINKLCFEPSGFLYNEFDRIFKDVFAKRSKIYKEIVKVLVNNSKTFTEICQQLNKTPTGAITKYLLDLEKAGFIRKEYVYNLKNKITTKAKYRLKDNYVRFYLKYIEPYKNQDINFSSLENWDSIFGLQFKNIVLNNLVSLFQLLELEGIVSASPYFTKTMQIDLLIQTKYQNLYVCEIKTGKKIGAEIIQEVKDKIEKLKYPKNFSIRPILIYSGEVSEELKKTNYFIKLVSAEDFLLES